jgi:hypothetical protein
MDRLRAIRPPSGSILGLTGLLLMVSYFCHRLYAGGFWLEGDADQAVYFWRHYRLLDVGFDLSQRDYFASTPALGAANPIHAVAVPLVGILFGGASVRAALFGNMLLSAFLLTAASWGVYALLRFAGRSVAAAVLGAVVATFTGFQLVGVREFDHFYLQSYACVPVALVAAVRLTLGIGSAARAFLWLAVAIHLSLVAGTNVPMFYYAPVFFALPMQAALARRSAMVGVRAAAGLAGAFALGIGLTAPVLLDGMTTLQVQNRSGLTFLGGFGSFAPAEFIQAVFLRDWWISGGIQYHERDVFFGGPVVALVVAGLGLGVRRWYRGPRDGDSDPSPEQALTLVFIAASVMALLVLHVSLLPGWLGGATAWYFEVQSIRFPMRFGMLLLLPAAHFAALAVDHARGPLLRTLTLGAMLVAALLLVQTPESSLWRQVDGVSAHMWLSLASQAVAGGLLFWRSTAKEGGARWIPPALAVAVFLGYSWAALPSTGYPLWFRASGLPVEAGRVFGSWDLRRIVGVRPLYGESLALAEARLSTPAPHLAGAGEVVGRVMDVQPVYSHSHGPVTGHAFAFDMVYDPAGHRLLWDLFRTGSETVLDLAHVGAIVVNGPANRPPTLSHARTFAPPGQLPTLRVRPAPLPLAFMVPAAVFAEDEGSLLRSVAGATRRALEDRVFLRKGAPHNAGPEDRAGDLARLEVSTRYRPEDGTLEIQVLRTGYLVISIPFHPQWVAARRGGGSLPVLRADYAFMAVPIESAPAEIELRFDRSTWRLSVWSSRLGLVLLVALATTVGSAKGRDASCLRT